MDGDVHEIVKGTSYYSPRPDEEVVRMTNAVYGVLSSFAQESGMEVVLRQSTDVELTDVDLFRPSLVFARRGVLADHGYALKGIPDLIVEVKTENTPDDPLGPKTDRSRDLGVGEFWLIVHNRLWKTQSLIAYGWEHGRWVTFSTIHIESKVFLGLELDRLDVFAGSDEWS